MRVKSAGFFKGDRSMKKNTILAILISLMMLPAAVNAAVVAKVGSLEITDKDVDQRLAQIPAQYKASYNSEEGRKMLLGQIVQEKLIYIQAAKEKYDSNAAVVEQLEKIRQRIMVGQYINDEFKKIQVSEDELKAYYDKNKSGFVQKEQVWAKHILLKTEAEAAAAKERVLKGESFEDVAKAVSTGPSGPKGGDLGWFEKDRMVPEFGKSAFNLDKDEISDPVKTQFGYHIIKVYGKKQAGPKSFEDARPDMEKTLIGDKQKARVSDIIEQVKKDNPVITY